MTNREKLIKDLKEKQPNELAILSGIAFQFTVKDNLIVQWDDLKLEGYPEIVLEQVLNSYTKS